MESNITETMPVRRVDEQKKDELLSDLVHNMKSPLNGIVAFIDAMTDESNTNSPQFSASATLPGASLSSPSLLNVLAGSARSLSRLLDEIVDYSDLYSDYPTARPYVNKPLHMGHVIDNVELVCRPLAAVKNVKVTKQVQPTLPPVIANKPKVTMMLSYLMEVCIKYSQSRSITVLVQTAKDERGVVVRIQDAERSVSPEEFFSLFDQEKVSQGYATRLY